MSINKMLIDATHPEETRVVVLKQGRVEEFDYESAARKQLRGNIYLAKVTRVEPSLQAAFVEYGGNRHGFLAFNEIHPDYYQIPMADRQALLEQEALAEAERAAADDADMDETVEDVAADEDNDDMDEADTDDDVVSSNEDDDPDTEVDPDLAADDDASGQSDADPEADTTVALARDDGETVTIPLDEASSNDETTDVDDVEGQSDDEDTVDEVEAEPGDDSAADTDDAEAQDDQTDTVDDTANQDDVLAEVQSRPRRRARSYKIQEVIKRRQVILVQVVKEERGNKGAALTTYLSLAGRYTVLMPNTARGGGISRKITNLQDRKRLKVIANELDVPEGMGLIVRTAGASRTKQELRRDFEYLLRLWESVRDLTLDSSAPSLVYEEGNLIKRSIRDLYNKDIDEVLVAGGDAYKQAKDFMRMLMPSHAKNVVHYQEPESLFTAFGIERQLNAMFSPQVTLRSGGYLIINQTEALVAIDVNSGKATREFSIEETALATNLEAASEISRQLKLRDLAGLIVIDFIDMDERRNNRAVERRLKEALKHDRARIQFGRISHFGLLEMSRQRLRTGVLEGSTSQCPHCQGTGIIRSTDSVALAVLRAIEDAVMVGEPGSIVATTSSEAAIYILNHKRGFLNEIEHRYGITVAVEASDKMQGANFSIGKVTNGASGSGGTEKNVVNMDWGYDGEAAPQDDDKERKRSRGGRGRRRNSDRGQDDETASDDQKPRRRRRRRGRRGERSPSGDEQNAPDVAAQDDNGEPKVAGDGPQPDVIDASNGDGPDASSDEPRKPRRRRGRRGGNRDRRGRGRKADGATTGTETAESTSSEDASPATEASSDDADQPKNGARHDASMDRHDTSQQQPQAQQDAKPDPAEPAPSEAKTESKQDAAAKPPRRSSSSSAPKIERVVVAPDTGGAGAVAEVQTSEKRDEDKSTRRGWWNRRLGRS